MRAGRVAALAVISFLTFLHGQQANGVVGEMHPTETIRLTFFGRCIGVVEFHDHLDSLILLHKDVEVVLAQARARKGGSPLRDAGRKINMRGTLNGRIVGLEFSFSDFYTYLGDR